jgi:uncharacterized protein YmfQ (DUF2313 family)
MGLIADDYRAQLQALLPQGPAWPDDADSATWHILDGIAQELARIDGRCGDLIEEADPLTTFELLGDWERVVGLLACRTSPAALLSQRRAELHAKLTNLGGQTPQYFIDLAASIGIIITITEFRPWTCDMACNLPIYGEDWAYTWQVNAPLVTIKYWTCIDACNEPLAVWGNDLLECLLTLYKPAHTFILFAYS